MDTGIPTNCLTFNLQRAARAAGRRLDAALRPVGLTAQQFSAIAHLAGHGTLATSALAEIIGSERTTVTRNLRVLRDLGLVVPADDPDRRVAAVRLSAAGKAVYDKALPLWREAQCASLARLTDAENFLKQLRRD